MVLTFERKNLVVRGRLLSSNVFQKFSWKCMNNLAYMQASLVLLYYHFAVYTKDRYKISKKDEAREPKEAYVI